MRPQRGPSPLPPSFPLLHAGAGGFVLYHKSCEMWLNTKPFSPESVTHEVAPEGRMKGEEKKLLELFGRLASEQQDKLIAFAEFLSASEPGAGNAPDGVPIAIPRARGETVTMAIRRLVRTYPMLDRRKLMGEASHFMAQHALNDRPAEEVIDELEQVFARHYQSHKSQVTRHK